jgi:pyrroloquinoline quinone (PQQ) biosynthesis protein C
MVRKQIYIHRRHADWLNQLAEARGVSEAEVVRQAIEREVTGQRSLAAIDSAQAWKAIVAFAEARRATAVEGAPYQWRREDAYEEREARYGS